MSSERIKKLCDYIDQNKAKNYPIENSMLSKTNDFLKNGYLRMLAVILQSGKTVTEGQLNLYERIVEGAESINSAEEYMRQALEIDIQGYLEFVNECRKTPLVYRFVLDSLVLIGDGEKEENTLKLDAYICESLRIRKEELYYLIIFAKMILAPKEENVNLILESVDESSDVTSGLSDNIEYLFEGYDNSWREAIKDDDSEEIENFNEPENNSKIKYVGQCIDLTKEDVILKGKKEVEFEQCEFIGNGDSAKCKAISLSKCGSVKINNCIFWNIPSRVIRVDKIDEMLITNSEFQKCNYIEKNKSNTTKNIKAGLIYAYAPEKNGIIRIKNTIFENCGCISQKEEKITESFSNCKISASECKFLHCYNSVLEYGILNRIDLVLTKMYGYMEPIIKKCRY